MPLTDVSVYNYINQDTRAHRGSGGWCWVFFLGQSYWGISGCACYLCHISTISTSPNTITHAEQRESERKRVRETERQSERVCVSVQHMLLANSLEENKFTERLCALTDCRQRRPKTNYISVFTFFFWFYGFDCWAFKGRSNERENIQESETDAPQAALIADWAFTVAQSQQSSEVFEVRTSWEMKMP